MARYHLRFSNIHLKVIRATEKLFKDRPWSGTEEDKHQKFQRWLKKASEAYGLDKTPTLSVNFDQRQLIHIDATGHVITLDKYSVTNLFFAFRLLMQELNLTPIIDVAVQPYEAGEDALGWANSLFYQVNPRAYRRAVRRGLIQGVDAFDLLHPERSLQLCKNCEEHVWEAADGMVRHVYSGKHSCEHPDNPELVATPAGSITTVGQFEDEESS